MTTTYFNLKKQVISIFIILFSLNLSIAQVGIGTTTPDASAILELDATDRGFLPPRMSKADRDLIGSPAEGLTIYNIDDNCLNLYVGLGWRNLCAQVGPNDVINPETGQIWMDRNLGASQVATSSTDAASYGDLYQWGRAADGHEKILRVTGDAPTSGTTATNATTAVPNAGNPWDGLFINESSSPFDWLTTQDDNLWQGVNGTNNPCPAGYRVPTIAELDAERASWSSNNAAGAFDSPLKLPMAGNRNRASGSLSNVGSDGYYWSSTVPSTNVRRLFFSSSDANMVAFNRAVGYPVRCLKD